MDTSDWLIARGGDLQVVLFFTLLVLLLAAETLAPWRDLARPRRRRWRTNAVLTVLNLVMIPLVPVSFIAAAAWAEQRGVGLLHQAGLPLWATAATTLAVRAFISTGTHWLNHAVPWLWRIHRVHHLDTEIDVSTTVRFHPLEMLVGPVIGVPLVVAFGLSPWVLAAYELLDVAVTLFSHSNVRVPGWIDRWLRYVIVTPDLHRIHHSSWTAETDSNFGAVFPFWDLVLGTLRTAPRAGYDRLELGLVEIRGAAAQHLGANLLSPFGRDVHRFVAGNPANEPAPEVRAPLSSPSVASTSRRTS